MVSIIRPKLFSDSFFWNGSWRCWLVFFSFYGRCLWKLKLRTRLLLVLFSQVSAEVEGANLSFTRSFGTGVCGSWRCWLVSNSFFYHRCLRKLKVLTCLLLVLLPQVFVEVGGADSSLTRSFATGVSGSWSCWLLLYNRDGRELQEPIIIMLSNQASMISDQVLGIFPDPVHF